MRFLKKVIAIFCTALVFCIIAPSFKSLENTLVEAATKKEVVKITHKYKVKESNWTQKIILYGKAQDGSVVWKFSSPYMVLTELNTNEYYINKNVIYLFSDKLYAISKSTGKVKWTYDCLLGGTSVAFDSKDNIYFTGYYDNSLYCVSSQGKLKFETKFPERYYWPYKIKVSSGKIRVYIDGDYKEELGLEKHYLTFDKKGKYLGMDK